MAADHASLDTFPAGLRVLVVDDDLTCLSCLARLLQICQYQVTKCQRAIDAVSLLRDNSSKFDIVISDVYMPDMNGLELLGIIRLEMDLPVVMMSMDDSKEVVMKVITMGACDYLVKPVRKEEISVIWQHVVRKHKIHSESFVPPLLSPSPPARPSILKPISEEEYEDIGTTPDHEEENCGSSSGKMDERDNERIKNNNEVLSLKKPRLVWTAELHDQFVAAVNDIGLKNAVPKKILELMKVPGLTRENVASHLQKYRIYLRKNTEEKGQKKFNNTAARIHNVINHHNRNIPHQQIQSQRPIMVSSHVETNTIITPQGNPWCYNIGATNLPPPHGIPIGIDQDEFTIMQRDQDLDGGNHFTNPITSLMVDHHGNNFSGYDGTDQNASSFGTFRNSHIDQFSPTSCSGYDSSLFCPTLQ